MASLSSWTGGLRALSASLAALLALGGCGTVEYYAQSIGGHSALLQAARPIDQVLADPSTSDDLRNRLRQAQAARRFASETLGLPDNDSYTEYADVKRPYLVWNVVAAPELSLRPKQSCFMVVGCLDYRGYYSEGQARQVAARLAGQGWDVRVAGVPAYSTLGWYPDPLVNTFIRLPQAEVARMVFHELTHQAVYARNDSAFNESLATTVEQIGLERWLRQPGNAALRASYQAYDQRRRDFIGMLLDTRQQLLHAYGETGSRAGASPASPLPAGLGADEIARRRAAKARILADLRQRYEVIKRDKWHGYSGYDAWFQRSINNADFAALGTYHQWVPVLRAMEERCASCQTGTLAAFLDEARALARLPYAERQRRLRAEAQALLPRTQPAEGAGPDATAGL